MNNIKNKTKNLLNHHLFENFILILICLSTLFIITKTEPFFNNYLSNNFYSKFEIFSMFIFSLEYLLRLITLNKFSKLFKPLMLVDLLALLPFYLSFLPTNLIAVRLLRLFRILRIFKITRYSTALQNIFSAFASKKEELIISSCLFFGGVLLSAIFIYYAENPSDQIAFSSIPQALWWSVITFTSVGYGDACPITISGKFIASISAIIGVGFHGLFVGIIGSGLMSAFKK